MFRTVNLSNEKQRFFYSATTALKLKLYIYVRRGSYSNGQWRDRWLDWIEKLLEYQKWLDDFFYVYGKNVRL